MSVKQGREFDKMQLGGSVTELASYPLFCILKLMGTDFVNLNYTSFMDYDLGVDLFSVINIHYPHALATGKVGLGVKSEGDLIISGTSGYIYVPSPWWKTEYFEVRFEDSNLNKKYYYKFEGDGLRYELSEFVKMIQTQRIVSSQLKSETSIAMAEIIEKFLKKEEVTYI